MNNEDIKELLAWCEDAIVELDKQMEYLKGQRAGYIDVINCWTRDIGKEKEKN